MGVPVEYSGVTSKTVSFSNWNVTGQPDINVHASDLLLTGIHTGNQAGETLPASGPVLMAQYQLGEPCGVRADDTGYFPSTATVT